jgi:hypothetical protein
MLRIARELTTQVFDFAIQAITRTCAWKPCIGTIWLMRMVTGIQMRPREISLIAGTIARRRPCRLLVFGLGRDSLFWSLLNKRGVTAFLEDDSDWFAAMKLRRPELNSYLVKYSTICGEWQKVLNSPGLMQMELLDEIKAEHWDVIIVDAPVGAHESAPGRMQSIYTALSLSRDSSSDIFVHDCHREVEQACCDRLLTAKRFVGQSHTMRHYRGGDA